MTTSSHLRTALMACGAALCGVTGSQAASFIIDFSDLSLPPDSYYLGPDTNPGAGAGTHSTWMTAGGMAAFKHYYDAEWFSWGGFSYANGTNTATPGFGNQQSAYPGGGATSGGLVAPGGIFGLAYYDSFTPVVPTFSVPIGHSLAGMYVANTTYAYHYMASGLDGFMNDPANKFGGTSGTDPDYFKITASGYDQFGVLTGSLDYYLADFRFANSAQDFIRTDWGWFDLSGLGALAREVRFTVDSSDAFAPSYFALDYAVVVPEPSRALLLVLGLTAVLRVRRREIPRSR